MTVTRVSAAGGDPLDMARRLVMATLTNVATPPQDLIRERVRTLLPAIRAMGGTGIDEDWLVKEIESQCNVWVPSATTIEDQRGHIEWLGERQAAISWNFWDRYRRYLEDVDQMAPNAIGRLDDITEQILRRLEDPTRPGAWDRRGLVAGEVQSGKTANYIGLICKAIDAGYRLIVVLAGLHNSLRSQTQLRLDTGIIGFDTQQRMRFDQSNSRMGVGALPGFPRLYPTNPLTTSAQNGDFRMNAARQQSAVGGADPAILVIKKNGPILANLIKWATIVLQQEDPETGRKVVRDVSLLVIDDEADNASVNTRAVARDENGNVDEDQDPTRINGLIRQLLRSFEKTAYVGYTATPFANIYIDPDDRSERFGDALFPRSFIINLPVPSNYVGPVRVFGLAEGATGEAEITSGLHVTRPVDDYHEWMPDGHKKDHVPGSLPGSLKEAIRAFLLVIAARIARGQEAKHHSMLVHVTRFTDVQKRVKDKVDEEVAFLKQRVRYGDGDSPVQVMDELEALWQRDFVPTTTALADPQLSPVSWEQVRAVLPRAAAKIETREINGTARDALEYFEHRDTGLTVIAIGGDKLSRGLTLEGLSISYYLRASRMYDTLMQMGRWFGYRPGYMDLCRLYTTTELMGWYRDITLATEELRAEFDHMAALGQTPQQYGLRVRTHPDGLLITARAKMRNGQLVRLTFAGDISETIIFSKNLETISANFRATEGFLHSLSHTAEQKFDRDTRLWTEVDGADVVAFLEGFSTHDEARKARAPLLASYIRARLADGELTHWTVALVSSGTGRRVAIAGRDTGLIDRSPMDGTADHHEIYSVRRVVSPRDEALDLTAPEYDKALRDTQRAWDPARSRRLSAPDIPSGLCIREVRSPRHGLLLLYPIDPQKAGNNIHPESPPIVAIAISFPGSDHASAIEYKVNNIYWEQEYGEG